MLKLFLAAFYAVCIVPAHLIGRVLGRDSLLLRRPDRDSYWLAKASTQDVQGYFSPGSVQFGNGTTPDTPVPMSSWIAQLLVWLSRLFAPRRRESPGPTSVALSAASREQGIPDEIY